ncbi:ComEC/Rec2 family competence protein [Micropruina sp.]|uniref:ComEC/Rec2 family competence protein n=1 Tax=Micropruina sp. TaxID=2737536 RepID=UPI0039E360F8
MSGSEWAAGSGRSSNAGQEAPDRLSGRGARPGAAGPVGTDLPKDSAQSDKRAPDLRLVPAALAAWAGMWVATAGQVAWLSVGSGVVAVLALVAVRRRSWPMAAVALVLAGCMATGWARWWQQHHDPLTGLAADQAVGTVELVVVGTPRTGERKGVKPPWWLSAARLVSVDARGQRYLSGAVVQISASGESMASWAAVVPGTTVRAAVRLSAAEPGEQSAIELRAREPPVLVTAPGPIDSAVEQVRAGLRRSVAHLETEPRALVPALVVGDTSAMPSDLVERFRVNGLTHLTAVSGANLTLLLAFLSTLARACGVQGWWLRGLLGLGVIGFVVLCHAEPSVVRAAGMGLVGLVALGAGGRGGQAVRALCVAVVVIGFVEPLMARSLGFALSVLASAGIVAWSRAWTDVLASRMPRVLAEGICTPLAAQLATQPLVTAISGQVSVAGLVANLVAGPLVGPATVLGFLAAATAIPLPWVAMGFATGAGWCAQGLCWIARLGELLPGAAFSWPAGPAALSIVLAGCVGLVLVMPQMLRNPWLAAAAALLVVLALLRPPAPPGWPPRDWVVVFCDVGQGDATVVRVASDAVAIVDAGPDPAKLATCLRQLGVQRVPLAVLTHFHADHVTGVQVAVQGHRTERVVVSGATSPAAGRRLVELAAAEVGLTQVTPGTVLQVGALRLEVLAVRTTGGTTSSEEGESAAENDGSLVMRLTVSGVRLLLAGDVQEDGQRNALAAGPDLSADVLLVPHHGSGHQLPEFLAATHAAIAVFSVGADNDYGHPAARTRRAVEQLGMRVLRTDQQGSIGIGKTEQGIQVTTQR